MVFRDWRMCSQATDLELCTLSSFSLSAQKWKPVWLSLFPQSSSGIGRLEIQDMGGTVGFTFTATQSAPLNVPSRILCAYLKCHQLNSCYRLQSAGITDASFIA